MKWFLRFSLLVFVALSGCVSSDSATENEPVATVLQDGKAVPVYFPPCFFPEGATLNDHGRIPDTPLAGAGITTLSGLEEVRAFYESVLATQGWQIQQQEVLEKSYWVKACLNEQTIEIRAVQGTTDTTQIFLLYRVDGK